MKPLFLALLLLCFVTPLRAQEPASTAENPLAQLKDELKRVLDQAQLPFSEEQDKAIILMMEDRRKASEELFGNLMDFSAGPTQGQEADRLRSAIEWMRNEFKTRLQDFLRPDQLAAWNRYQESGAQATTEGAPRARPAQQTQYVRINNNAFTTETSAYGGRRTGNDAEVIQRGGAGDYHGNAQLLLKDESLNAGKRFASNKPPYQERRASFNFSGPVIPGRLSTAVAVNQNEAQNVDTIRATQPDGVIFALGITKPTTTRSFSVNNTFQIADAHSLALNVSYATDSRKNQGVGGFIMPDRASSFYGTDTKVELRQFSSLSSRSIFENSFAYTSGRDKTTPNTEGLKINVIDAFQSGGAQNKVDNTASTYDFGNLYTHLGEKLSMKLGSSVVYLTNRAFSENNFTGTFTFSDLNAYRNGQPISFRMAQGNPEGRTNQWELGFFLQNDFKMTSRLTLMYGARYEVQTNVPDHNNLDPRLGFAYAAGRATVIRGGGGIFHDRLAMNIVEFYRRLDGTQQSEIVIDNPSYPDPFKSGSVRNTLPTIRVFDPNLRSPYSAIANLSIERTFLSNLFVSVAYDYGRILHKYRNRNLNATYDARVTNGVIQACAPGQPAASCVRPDPSRGNVINLESTGSQTYDNVRLNFRERFSIFNITASYQYYVSWADSPNIGLVLGGGNGQGAGGGGSDNNGGGPEVLPTNNYNLRADWSRFAVPVHTINGSVNSRLPLGIFLTSALAVNDGRYYTITTGKDDNMDSSPNDRPPGVSRNSGDGQWSINTNFNLSKAFFFGAKASNGGTQPNVNLFANMTNAFNRPNYNNPSGVMTSTNFGKITSAAEPRNIEVGMRFQF